MNRFPMEIQDQFNYFAFKVCNQLLNCVLYFNERLDETLLAKAVHMSLDTDPILGCRLVLLGEAYWETAANPDCEALFKIIKTGDTEADLEAFLTQTINVEAGPLVQVRLLRGEKDILCIKLSHAVSDAGGIKGYACRLAAIYSSFAKGGSVVLTGGERRDQKQFIENLPQAVIGEFREKSAGFMQNMIPNWSFPSKNHSIAHPAYTIRRMEIKKIKDAAHRRNATLNDYLLAAFCRALLLEGGHPAERPMLVQVPVDLRRYLAAGTKAGVCNMSGAEYLKVQLKQEDGFETVLKKVQECMARIKSNYPGIASAFALEGLASLGFEQAMRMMQGNMEKGREHNAAIPILTNMGMLPEEAGKYGSVTAADGYLVSPIVFAPGFMVGVSSFGDTLTLTLGYGEDATGWDTAERFINCMSREMEAAALTSECCSYTI